MNNSAHFPLPGIDDAAAMRLAMVQATSAAEAGEVPVGAVVVRRGKVIAAGSNAPIGQQDPCAHAEILALRAAAAVLGNYRLDDCELFVTLEPCAMCAGAILHARLKRIVFGAFDLKTGAAGSVINLFTNTQLNHQTKVSGGLLADECSTQLKEFFRLQRQEKLLTVEPLREDALRTPLACFEGLPRLPGDVLHFRDLPTLNGLRLHVCDSGPAAGARVTLCLHGVRSWSLVWRTVMAERAALGERVLAVDLIGFGKSDKLKKLPRYRTEWHLQVLLELLDQLGISSLLVLEPAGDCLPGRFSDETLGQALMLKLPGRVLGRESVEVAELEANAADAPYPDPGHRAVFSALAHRDMKP